MPYPDTVTHESIFQMNRRDILKFLGLTAAAAIAPAVLAPGLSTAAEAAPGAADLTPESSFKENTNFYEFGTGKLDPAKNAKNFKFAGHMLRVDGMVKNPMTLPADALTFKREERIYRMRCVEGWSMTIPWGGFSLSELLNLVQPLPGAKYVAFTSIADPVQMPEVKRKSFPFPYVEGLRLDEAMHPLAMLVDRAYGKPLAPQNGPPLRLVVPWKYGFKSAKSLARITLTDKEPVTTWTQYASDEYGFYANVNPAVPHPRWPQDEETFFGPGGLNDSVRKPTLLFNGYDEVAGLYKGMDLTKFY